MKFKIGNSQYEDQLNSHTILKMGFELMNSAPLGKDFISYIDGSGLMIHHCPQWIDKGYSTNIAIQQKGATMSQLPALDHVTLFNRIQTIRTFAKPKIKDEVETKTSN